MVACKLDKTHCGGFKIQTYRTFIAAWSFVEILILRFKKVHKSKHLILKERKKNWFVEC